MFGKYKYLLVPLITLLVCQTLKFTIESIVSKKLVWSRLFKGTGGMPSSHSSFSISLTMMIGLNLGFDNPLFAVSLVFSTIVCYDAMGLRMESGRQAEAINKIFDQISKDGDFTRLKEKLGHKPEEVLGGIILGIASALLFSNI